MEENRKLYSVGQICESTKITRKTLFYYDKIGLLSPSERTGTQQFKLYDEDKISRLNQIMRYRKAGLRIAEIRELLDDGHADRLLILREALERLQRANADVDQEIRNLKTLIEAEKDKN